MSKGRKSARNLKHDPLVDQYIQTAAWAKSNSQPILKYAAIAGGILIIAIASYWFMSARAKNAHNAFAKAMEYNDAPVSNPKPAGLSPDAIAFTTDDAKHRAAYDAFVKAADEYPSYNGEIAGYYAAMHQLHFEPAKAEPKLKELAEKNSEVGSQARLALAERYAATAKYNEAINEYNKLKSNPGTVPTQLIDISLGRAYEAQGKGKEAIDLYFAVANNKDWRGTEIGVAAAARLAIIAPEKADQLPPPESKGAFSNFGRAGGLQ